MHVSPAPGLALGSDLVCVVRLLWLLPRHSRPIGPYGWASKPMRRKFSAAAIESNCVMMPDNVQAVEEER